MDSSVERWRSIAGYEGLYEVSDRGRVKSLPRKSLYKGKAVRQVPGGVMKGSKHAFGYPMVTLSAPGRRKICTVHCLVLEAFAGPRPDGCECRHLDGDPANCHLENLAWGSHRENEADKWKHGTRGLGSLSPGRKLTEESVAAIRRDSRQQAVVARDYGITQSNVSCIRLRKTWRHVPDN